MKAKNLIALLQTLPPEMEVALADWSELHAHPCSDFCAGAFGTWEEYNYKTCEFEKREGWILGLSHGYYEQFSARPYLPDPVC